MKKIVKKIVVSKLISKYTKTFVLIELVKKVFGRSDRYSRRSERYRVENKKEYR